MSHSARPPVGTRIQRIGWNNPDGLTEEIIRAVVDRFYADARLDPLIGPVFNSTIAPDAWPAHLATIADFWSSMLLGSGRYTGRPMPKHMALPRTDRCPFPALAGAVPAHRRTTLHPRNRRNLHRALRAGGQQLPHEHRHAPRR